MRVLSELKSMVSSVGARMDALETKLLGRGSFDALGIRLDELFAKMKTFEDSISRIDSVVHTADRLSTMVDGVTAGHASLANRIADIEGRCLALEGSTSRAPSGSPSPSVVDDLASRLSGFEWSQRDHELIIFGLPDVDGDRSHLLMSLASALDLGFAQADIADSIRLRSNRSASRPLVIKFISMARRNEWLAVARRHRDITARSVCESWPEDRLGIYERSTAKERSALAEARSLARGHGIKHI